MVWNRKLAKTLELRRGNGKSLERFERVFLMWPDLYSRWKIDQRTQERVWDQLESYQSDLGMRRRWK